MSLDIDIECHVCKCPLEHEERLGTIKVYPCDVCLEKARDEGFKQGKEELSGVE